MMCLVSTVELENKTIKIAQHKNKVIVKEDKMKDYTRVFFNECDATLFKEGFLEGALRLNNVIIVNQMEDVEIIEDEVKNDL